jgi:anti-anti-sigma factor
VSDDVRLDREKSYLDSTAELETFELDGVQVLVVAGEIDLSNVTSLREAAISLRNDALGIVLDLTAATFIDSATLSLIFELQHSLARRCQAFRIVCAAGSNPRRVLELSALDRETPCDQDRDAAVAAIRRSLQVPDSAKREG